jgi:hypothetical protein
MVWFLGGRGAGIARRAVRRWRDPIVWLHGAFVALLLSLAPAGAALADNYTPPDNYVGANFLTVDVLSSTTLDVKLSILGFDFSGAVTADPVGSWGLPPIYNAVMSSNLEGNSLVLGHVYWMQPGDNPTDLTNDLFTGFDIASCFCSLPTEIDIASDLPFSVISDHDSHWNDFFCIEPGSTAFVNCPIVPNGTAVSTPLVYQDADGAFQASPLVITVTDDRGGGGVPEPATWAMMLIGFGGLGAMLRARRASVPRPV